MSVDAFGGMLAEGDQLAGQLLVYAQSRGLCARDLLVAISVAECLLGRGFDMAEGCSDSSREAAAEGLALFRTTQFVRFDN